MKVKISKKLQEALNKVGLTAPETSADADRKAGLLDEVLIRSRHLSSAENELLAMAVRELDKLAAKLVVIEYQKAVEAYENASY